MLFTLILFTKGKAVKAMCKTKKNDPSPKEPSSSMFDPISIDEEEERCRRRALTARKKVMDSLGIQETVSNYFVFQPPFHFTTLLLLSIL